MKTIDLFINRVPNVDAPAPWDCEKTRTFCCVCAHVWAIPKDAILWDSIDGKDCFAVDGRHFEGKCPKCGKPNFELLSFCKLYGLFPKIKEEKKKKMVPQQPSMLDLMIEVSE